MVNQERETSKCGSGSWVSKPPLVCYRRAKSERRSLADLRFNPDATVYVIRGEPSGKEVRPTRCRSMLSSNTKKALELYGSKSA